VKILVGIAGGWIGVSLADKALFGGRMTQVVLRLARSIASGFGVNL
jgi:hypothetical protein